MGRKSKNKGGGGGGAPDWMVTYGDLMSLLLCFFVMLVSMSSIQEAKFKLALGSLMGALGVMHYETSVVDLEHLPKTERYDEEVERILDEFNEFQEQIEEEGLEGDIEVIETEQGMLIRMANPLLFESGKAELKKSGIDILTKLASVLLEFDSQIRIEGHTDNVAIHTEEFLELGTVGEEGGECPEAFERLRHPRGKAVRRWAG